MEKMTLKQNCDSWIDFTYDNWLSWLRIEKSKTYLRESTRNLLARVKKASTDPNRSEEAWNLLERLKRLSENFNNLDDNSKGDGFNLEYPEVFLECALTAYRMGDIHEAQELFKVPIGRFQNRSIHKAMSYWLYGCIQWQLPSHMEDALLSWEQSLKIIKDAASDNRYDQEIRNWCKVVEKEMIKAINTGSINSSPPPAPSITNISSEKKANIRQHILQTLPVIGKIPAGMPLDVLPTTEDYLNIDKVSINDQDYQVVSLLRGEKIVNIPPGSCFYVMQVYGNSMNDCSPEPIEDGNYVILREQHMADNGEIVAAIIIKDEGEGERLATLKRYVVRDGKIFLKPESKDPKFQKPVYMSRVFDKLDDEVQIRGVAVGVLKPLPKTTFG
jgi:SOS-response transcriptional repressor LexA